MTDQTLRRAIEVMAAAIVIIVGITVVLMLSRGGPGGAASATAAVVTSPTAAGPSPSASASVASASTSTEPSATPSPSPTPTATPSPTPTPAPTNSLTFVGLQLDATDDPAGEDRVITFTSDGAGTVTAVLVSQTPQGTTVMCLRAGTKELGCKDWSEGTFTGKTTQRHTNWRLTVRGSGTATPVVDVTVTYQAEAAKVKIANARFNGTAEPGLNGIQVRFVPRGDGDARLVASWGGHPFLYEIDTFDETDGSGGSSYPNQGPSTDVDQPTPVTAGDTWRLVLQNIETGSGTTDLTATISWP